MTRKEILEAFPRQPEVSVLVFGAGISGVGQLCELALQGVDALLVDKADSCAGASAASTRVIHGALRHLENREFRLVKESLRGRNRLLKNASHYVRPLPTTIPVFSWANGRFSALGRFLGLNTPSADWRALLLHIGLPLYDY